jgi:hypothetical protein
MKELSVSRSLIISYGERREIYDPAGVIRIIPAAEWLLEK